MDNAIFNNGICRMDTRTTRYNRSNIQTEKYVYNTYTENGVTYTTNQLLEIDDQTSNNRDRTSTYDSNGNVTLVEYNNKSYGYFTIT